MTQRYAILVGGPLDGTKLAVEHFTREVHIAVMEPLNMEPVAGDRPIDYRREEKISMPTGVYLGVGSPVRPRERALREGVGSSWLPNHEVCMYVFIGKRP